MLQSIGVVIEGIAVPTEYCSTALSDMFGVLSLIRL